MGIQSLAYLNFIHRKDPQFRLTKIMSQTRNRKFQQITNEIRDVQITMVGNMDALMDRGKTLNQLQKVSSDLSTFSENYYKNSKKLNRSSLGAKIAAGGGLLCLIFYLIKFYIL